MGPKKRFKQSSILDSFIVFPKTGVATINEQPVTTPAVRQSPRKTNKIVSLDEQVEMTPAEKRRALDARLVRFDKFDGNTNSPCDPNEIKSSTDTSGSSSTLQRCDTDTIGSSSTLQPRDTDTSGSSLTLQPRDTDTIGSSLTLQRCDTDTSIISVDSLDSYIDLKKDSFLRVMGEYENKNSVSTDEDGDADLVLEDAPQPDEEIFVDASRDRLRILSNITPLPLLQDKPSWHCVLFRLPMCCGEGVSCPPYPLNNTYNDVWDNLHVRMPCSPRSLYPDADNRLVSRWNLIEQSLLKLVDKSSGRITSYDLEEAIYSYNTHISEQWSFNALHEFFNEELRREERMQFFHEILPAMVRLALDLPNLVTGSVPLLSKLTPDEAIRSERVRKVTLSQQQCASLLANAFFCTFPRRNKKPSRGQAHFPSINFNTLYGGSSLCENHVFYEKLRCLIHYFHRVTHQVPTGVLSFERLVLKHSYDWETSQSTFKDVLLHASATGNIEDDGVHMLQVDFANKILGGGVLNWGCVQEEIRMLLSPELILSRLLTEELGANEALVMTGFQRFSNYTGYADTFKWHSDYVESADEAERDGWGRRKVELVAIDALQYRSNNLLNQFHSKMVRRELNKALVGFSANSFYLSNENRLSAVATGNWGCGVFRGNVQLKSLIQLMACAVVSRDLCYFTFGNRKLRDSLAEIHEFLCNMDCTVADAWTFIKDFYLERSNGASRGEDFDLFRFIYEKFTSTQAGQRGWDGDTSKEDAVSAHLME